ncbi:class I SAM-dependent methyltransferase [Luteimonas aestuarii]|nr:class I SAM-dependent methyltransferase [Luteimonas aestuarii]
MSPATERRLSGVYRSLFVNLDRVAESLLPHIPENARVLDIGGGDGELINRLLKNRPDVSVDMVDIAPTVGKFIEQEYEPRIKRFTETPVESLASDGPPYDVALVSDVMHHLPASYRAPFLHSVRQKLRSSACILIKDIEPGHIISWLSLFCDKHISGDHGVSLVSIAEMTRLAAPLLPEEVVEVGLLKQDSPNYALKIVLGESSRWTKTDLH